MFEFTVDEGLRLRTFHPDDTEALFALLERNRSRLRPWIDPSALPETVYEARLFVIECYFNSFDEPMEVLDSPYFPEVGHHFRGLVPPQMELGIWKDGRLVGEVSRMFRDERREAAEFGYWISAEEEGQGIITRCVRALMDEAASDPETTCFVIGCARENRRSAAIPERLGYALCETIPGGEVVGRYVYDRLVYELSVADWRKRGQTGRSA